MKKEEKKLDDSFLLKSFQMEHPTNPGEIVNKFKYLEGMPRQYRFDAKKGSYNINGNEWLPGSSFTFQPIAWRIFEDDILNMGKKKWAEIFFIDDKNCLSAILFHGYSVDNIFRLIEPLFYDDLTLADVLVTATAEKKEYNPKDGGPKGTYYIAEFTYKNADPDTTKTLKEFVKDSGVKIFRLETLTEQADVKAAVGYYNPYFTGEADTLLNRPKPDGVDNDGVVE